MWSSTVECEIKNQENDGHDYRVYQVIWHFKKEATQLDIAIVRTLPASAAVNQLALTQSGLKQETIALLKAAISDLESEDNCCNYFDEVDCLVGLFFALGCLHQLGYAPDFEALLKILNEELTIKAFEGMFDRSLETLRDSFEFGEREVGKTQVKANSGEFAVARVTGGLDQQNENTASNDASGGAGAASGSAASPAP